MLSLLVILFAFWGLPFIILFLVLSLFVGQVGALKYIGLGIVVLIAWSFTFQWLTAKKVLGKEDYYGHYIINRDYFKGRQTDWQYNSFRFEIRENDSIYFYYTDKERILQTFKGKITTTAPYESQRLMIQMDPQGHHILASNPTTYRSAWSFYLVFHSPEFNNVFFKKGKWKAID